MKTGSITAFLFVLACTVRGAEGAKTSSQAEQEGAPLGTQIQTAGKVVGIHVCPMVGMPAPHTIVKIETEQGDTDIVDLGPTPELKSNGLDLKEGQKLWVDGRVGQINDKFLIVADQLSETKMITIPRMAPLTQETMKHADARNKGESSTAAADVKTNSDPKAPKAETVEVNQPPRTVEGTVIHTRRIKIEGEADEHVVAKLQTSNGIAVVDLGTCPLMPSTLNLNEGQSLAATGYVGQINGKPIIYAESAGNLSQLRRPLDGTTNPAINSKSR